MPLVAIPTSPNSAPIYTDVNREFGSNIYPTLIYDINAINLEIENILGTIPGERVFEPLFGSNLTNYLFDPIDEVTAWKMENEISFALGRWMPRIVVDKSLTRATPLLLTLGIRGYDMIIAYSLVGLNITSSYGLRLAF